MTADTLVTMVTEAATEAQAVDIMRMASRSAVVAVADLLHVEADGHSLATVRRACVREARS